MTKLLVANGGEDNTKSVEVINLNADNLVCDNLPDFPLSIRGTTGQLFRDSKSIICGGVDPSKFTDSCKCFAYLDGYWNAIASLDDCRRFPVSTLLTNKNNEEILYIAGGASGFLFLDSVESFDGSEWHQEMFAELPKAIGYQCLLNINNSFLFMIGGYDKNIDDLGETYFYSIEDNSWSPGNI